MLPNQLRLVVRKLRQSPLFTGVALMTMALAIGANTAVFSVVNGVLLKPLPLLGIKPELGCLFRFEDDQPDAPRTVILGHGYWQSRFGGDAGAIGQTLRIDGNAHEIIGVLPADLQFLDYDPQLCLPFRFDRADLFLGNFSYQAV